MLLIFGSIFGNYPLQQMDEKASAFAKGLYHALPRVALPTALSFIVFACHYGYGGIMNWVLSLPQWQPISRLTYSMYITHVFMIYMLDRQIRTPRQFSDLIMVLNAFIINRNQQFDDVIVLYILM